MTVLADTQTALIEANLPLVASLCRRMCYHQADREDLYQQGCIGLIQAAERYDPKRGTAFSTFAVPYIMGEMRACCHAADVLRIPRSERTFQVRLRQVQEDLTRRLARTPNLTELAAEMHLDPPELAQHMETAETVSLSEALADDNIALCLQDTLTDDDPWLERLMLFDLLERLPSDEYTLYLLRFQQHLTQQQTAHRMSLSQSQISRMEAALRRKLSAAWKDA